MPFSPTNFQNKPSTATPLTAAELNKLGTQYTQAKADALTDVEDAIGDTGTGIGSALSATFVRFVDQNGDPLPAGSITTIHVNTTTGEIDDITFEGA
jgi:hypothetical protein